MTGAIGFLIGWVIATLRTLANSLMRLINLIQLRRLNVRSLISMVQRCKSFEFHSKSQESDWIDFWADETSPRDEHFARVLTDLFGILCSVPERGVAPPTHPHTLAALRVSRVLFNRIHLCGASVEGRKQQKNGPKPRKKNCYCYDYDDYCYDYDCCRSKSCLASLLGGWQRRPAVIGRLRLSICFLFIWGVFHTPKRMKWLRRTQIPHPFRQCCAHD